MDHFVTYSRIQSLIYLKNLGFSSEQSFWCAGLSLSVKVANSPITESLLGVYLNVSSFYVNSKLSLVQDMLLCVCCAMLLCVKSRLLNGDFAANFKLLQHYPDINIEHPLQVARDLSPDTSSYRLSL